MRHFLFIFASFLLTFAAFSGAAFAQQLDSYFIDADLDSQGAADVKLDMIFAEPTNKIEFILPFRISNFNVTTTTGSVLCNNQLSGTSFISCSMNLTQNKTTLEINFQSLDMVKTTSGGFEFTGDFSLKVPVDNVFAAVRLPGGMVLSQNIPGGSTIPFTNSTSTDGRKITVLWRFINADQKPLNFQVFYEPGIEQQQPTLSVPPLRVLALLAIIFGGGIGLIIFRRMRKTKEVIFSVLDDYEKRVVSSIEKEGGTINQKKIVIDTNLSKAKVSRVVQKLMERGLIQVERRGRTNIIKFIKKNLGS